MIESTPVLAGYVSVIVFLLALVLAPTQWVLR